MNKMRRLAFGLHSMEVLNLTHINFENFKQARGDFWGSGPASQKQRPGAASTEQCECFE
jgi:hypothetical protein